MANAARKPAAAKQAAGKKQAPRLRVVTEQQQEAPTGNRDLTREAMSGWKAGQRTCRARKRHNWGPHMVWEHRTYYEVVEQCGHCRNRRSAEFTKTEYGLRKATKWTPVYRDGYLLPAGAMRIVDDLHEELTAADILSRRIVEVPDDDGEV